MLVQNTIVILIDWDQQIKADLIYFTANLFGVWIEIEITVDGNTMQYHLFFLRTIFPLMFE